MKRDTAPQAAGPQGWRLPLPVMIIATLGLAYEAVLLFTPLLNPYRFPISYAVPIFDTPFALVATGVGYLCLERHRLRHDFQSVVVGVSLWFAALLAVAHILTQPDYPGTPGVDPGIAPYLFFGSYFAALSGVALGTHYADRRLPMTDRGRWTSVVGAVVLTLVVVAAVFEIRPLLPPLVMPPGRLTPFAIWTAGILNGAVALWALWGWRRRVGADRSPVAFANLLALAAFIWLLGLLGFLISPHRYGISWYLAGVARPLGVGVIFVALLREQVWLYREARARLRDLEQLHQAGHVLLGSLDASEMVRTIAARGLMIAQADASILFRLDTRSGVVRAVACSGPASRGLEDLELPTGPGASGLAALSQHPVWSANVHADRAACLPPDIGARLAAERLTAVLAVPLLASGDEVFGSLSVLYRAPRTFTEADVELLSAFGTQASAALENARAFDRLALRAMHDADLQEFARRLLEATAEKDVVDDAIRMTARLLSADAAGLFLTGPGGRLRLAAGLRWPPNHPERPGSDPSELFDRCAVTGSEPMEIHDPPGIMVPLGVGEQPVGVLVAAYDRPPGRFTAEDRRVLASLAHQTALALEKIRLYTELQDNLTRLQEMQAQLMQAEKLTALGTLLSGMAHELNNPLSTIRLSVALIKRTTAVDAGLAQRLAVIERACGHASRIVGDLLLFARRQAPERRRVDINEIIRSTLGLHAPQFQLNKIRAVTSLEPVPAIWGDAHQLQQVFLNLFSNAIDAMREAHGHGTLTVRSVHRGPEIVVEVADDGPGIRPEHLGRIFDPFFTTKPSGTGTGLGLSVSIGIVEAHGGRMHAETAPGAGARFILHLPVGEDVDAEPPVGPSPPLPDVAAADVLVVEDAEDLRGLIGEAVRHLGHRVVEVTTGQQALDRLQERRYDLVMLDLRLPDIDGQVVWQVALAPDLRLAARVVFMTGDIMSAETQRFLDETGRPYLIKPFTIEQVGGVVSEVLANLPGRSSTTS